MSWAILRCNKCGRVFFYQYCAHKRTECINTKVCNNKIWIEKDSMMNVKYGTDFLPVGNTAYIFISVFNNYACLSARIYSEDGKNFIVIPISERYAGELTRKDTLLSLPEEVKHTSAWDGLIIESGCYPVSDEMKSEMIRNYYERVPA